MTNTIAIDFEKAVRLLTIHLPLSRDDSRKPILFHSIRVGNYLYDNNYGADLVLAGVLHDAIEWSDLTEQDLKDQFGGSVAGLVLACTKNDSILDKEEKTIELIRRCIQYGQDALIVKTADILDSFKWYASQDNQEELQYCMRNAAAFLKFKSTDYNDKIFDELKNWHGEYSEGTKRLAN